MALNGNLTSVLDSVIDMKPPIIKLNNGLYALINYSSVVPDANLGTNLLAQVEESSSINDNIFENYKLLGLWDSVTFLYNTETYKWEKERLM